MLVAHLRCAAFSLLLLVGFGWPAVAAEIRVPEDHKTIGFLSRVSPDAKYVVTTLNETLFVQNFLDYRFLQVFYPTGGILGWYSTETEEMKALPGADDPEFVHCAPVWTPDGGTLIFSTIGANDRARGRARSGRGGTGEERCW